MSEFHYYKLHVEGQEGDQGRYVVKGYGDHEKHSVCYGQTRIVFLDAFSTEAEAREKYGPLLDAGYGSKLLDQDLTRMPDVAPDWFDPADAGEVWSEEDY